MNASVCDPSGAPLLAKHAIDTDEHHGKVPFLGSFMYINVEKTKDQRE